MAFRTLRHVLRPAIREGTRHTFLLFAGRGAQGPWGGTSQISPFLFYDAVKKKKKTRGRRRDRSNLLCQRGGWLRRANGGGRAPGTGAALRPVLAGIRAMNGTLSAKRCVKLAPCSAAEARQVGPLDHGPARPLGRRLAEHRGEAPPHIVC